MRILAVLSVIFIVGSAYGDIRIEPAAQAEYAVWRYSGDGISHPSSSNAFPGGLTILFGPPILGKTVDVPPNIGMPIKASSKFG